MSNSVRPGAATRAVAAFVLIAALTGCGGNDDEKSAAGEGAVGKPVQDAAVAAEAANDKRMANAVATSKLGAPVDLRYDLLARPDVGVPVEVELELAPRLAADAIELEVTGIPGLTIVTGEAARFDGIVAGEKYVAKVTVQADAPGIYYANVLARMITQVQTEVRAFSVPVIVGVVPSAQKAGPERDGSGEPVQPLPAAESGGPAPVQPED